MKIKMKLSALPSSFVIFSCSKINFELPPPPNEEDACKQWEEDANNEKLTEQNPYHKCQNQ